MKFDMNTGRSIPALALGTWLANGQSVFNAALHALRVGYRHIDTAYVYKNESEIGRAVKQFLSENPNVSRSDLFITTKVWNTFHSKHNVLRNFEMSLKSLQTSYVDLYLMHWPMGYKEDTGDDVFVPKDADGNPLYSQIDYMETYSAMESLYKDGKALSIGVSNFKEAQMLRLLDKCEIKPSVLQIETHPFRQELALLELCKQNNVVMEAYAPLGAPNRPRASRNDPSLLNNDVIRAIASRLNCSPAAVLISWCLSRKVVCLVKSVTPTRIEENFNAQNVQLDGEAIKEINKLGANTSFKYYMHRDGSGHPEYPFK